jgi:hypothetical protein
MPSKISHFWGIFKRFLGFFVVFHQVDRENDPCVKKAQ